MAGTAPAALLTNSLGRIVYHNLQTFGAYLVYNIY